VDGGMAANSWLMQFLADVTGLRVDRPRVTETTALGAAYLAGYGAGLFDSLESVSARWQLDARFEARMDAQLRERLVRGWHSAIGRVIRG
jgi:glycerol kinase